MLRLGCYLLTVPTTDKTNIGHWNHKSLSSLYNCIIIYANLRTNSLSVGLGCPVDLAHLDPQQNCIIMVLLLLDVVCFSTSQLVQTIYCYVMSYNPSERSRSPSQLRHTLGCLLWPVATTLVAHGPKPSHPPPPTTL